MKPRGVHGWVKVFSHTRPRENIFHYSPWFLRRAGVEKQVSLSQGKCQGKLLLAKLDGIDSREQALSLSGADLLIDRSQLPEPESDEYYWTDLLGLTVSNTRQEVLGFVDGLLETGANDVLIVKGDREHLIPFVQGVHVLSVDLEQGLIQVDWDMDF